MAILGNQRHDIASYKANLFIIAWTYSEADTMSMNKVEMISSFDHGSWVVHPTDISDRAGVIFSGLIECEFPGDPSEARDMILTQGRKYLSPDEIAGGQYGGNVYAWRDIGDYVWIEYFWNDEYDAEDKLHVLMTKEQMFKLLDDYEDHLEQRKTQDSTNPPELTFTVEYIAEGEEAFEILKGLVESGIIKSQY